MAKVRKSGIAVLAAVVLIAAGGYVVLDQLARDKARAAAASARPSGVPVSVGVAETRDVPVFVRGIGTVQANKMVTVKTRVDGQIVKVLFEEGKEVKEGDPLFQVDPQPYQAALDRAVATKQRDEAQLEGAQLDLERYGKLLAPGFQSRQSYDQQKATVDALKGTIASDQAAIDTAKLNLDYATIRAPISGRTGQRLVDLGNLVTTGQNIPLVSITQTRPIFVNFTVPQDHTDEIRTNQKKTPLAVEAYASDDKTLLAEGKVTLIDNQIEQATGTLRLKASFQNANERLWPGEFVNVRLVLDTRKGAVTVPQRVVLQGAEDYYCYVAKPDNTVERRTIKVAATQDGIAVIESGLAAGEKVVVDGQYRLTNGARIRIDTKSDPTPQGQQPGTATNPGAPAEHG